MNHDNHWAIVSGALKKKVNTDLNLVHLVTILWIFWDLQKIYFFSENLDISCNRN